METILNDAFHADLYLNHIPTDVLAKNKRNANIALIIIGVVVVGALAYKYYKIQTKALDEIQGYQKR